MVAARGGMGGQCGRVRLGRGTGDLGAFALDARHPVSAYMVAQYVVETAAGLIALAVGWRGLAAAAATGSLDPADNP
ncbi:hypothetical protein ACFQZC_38100 [Streptacidiphilus monticola]